MSDTTAYPNLLTRLWRYVVLFVRCPDDIASLAPSSAFLTRKLAGLPCVQNAKHIVELGPGDGGVTRDLLEAMSPQARLLAIELLPDLVEVLQSINDDRLIVEHADACELASLVETHHLKPVDVVVSGIPFSILDREPATQIIEAIYDSLTPGGTFVAYQVRDEINGLALKRFGEPEITWVPWNLPPVRLFQWTKPG
ncbi:class I SAM-dependent methyltransferase [Fuerstiella marisgermanici]|uniref:16S ribosomal RNA methyltransferase KsgA/Dim1 family protein n=1 Tax=Fuerstiella marisgermanici TaxID=1891926 RepID=A0A1P8WE14_9PLAN|nr:methyltransferase domain-containing protein [Fuerstiella marisgermanici]APZ92267.1 16S ribosomal RNA methyltransferase KsgA/Dim1 family protein [Fuerstiella marisgermanici]